LEYDTKTSDNLENINTFIETHNQAKIMSLIITNKRKRANQPVSRAIKNKRNRISQTRKELPHNPQVEAIRALNKDCISLVCQYMGKIQNQTAAVEWFINPPTQAQAFFSKPWELVGNISKE
jgi:hypothetical protein